MKLNWFSPAWPDHSPLALQTAAALPRLAKYADITLWVHEAARSPELDRHVRVRRYDPAKMPWSEINAADATVYHLGGQAEVYGPIWQVNRQHAGIVLLHDVLLQPLFAGLVKAEGGLSRSEYREMMKFHHPERGAEAADDLLSGSRTAEEIARDFPLTGVAFVNATSVVVHTQAACSLVSNLTTLPVAFIPLFDLANRDSSGASRADGVDAYVNGLLAVVRTTLNARGREAVRWMAGRAAHAMRPWFSEVGAGVLIIPVAQTIRDLFDEDGSPEA